MTDHVEVRSGSYLDSVTLMQVSREVAAVPGVSAAQVAMATDLNVDVITGMGFAVPAAVQPNDLVVAIRADDPAGAEAGLSALESALTGLRQAGARAAGFGEAPPPRTLGTALARGSANLALVSVPGDLAAVEAWDALDHGASVMVFSDNVPVEQEVRLKEAAADRDLLVMGPDCGTAVVGGVALGFANVVQPGPVGLVAASGTGAQQVMALLDAAGVGVSHCLGVGGRDLSAAVAGRSTRQALAALAADDQTAVVLVVSKPPAAAVLQDLERYAAGLGKPVHWATLGPGRPDLTAAVTDLLGSLGPADRAIPPWPRWEPSPHWEPSPGWETSEDPGGQRTADRPKTRGPDRPPSLRGLFCGGTLADEAMLVAQDTLGDIRSNIPLRPELALGPDLRAEGHVVIDFGEDQLTRGRAHPMIDPTLRLERLGQEAADPACGVLLLDLVLGHGAHPNPAPELAHGITRARDTATKAGRDLQVVVSLTGTRADPQGLDACADLLAAAGAWVYLSNAEATRRAVALLGSATPGQAPS